MKNYTLKVSRTRDYEQIKYVVDLNEKCANVTAYKENRCLFSGELLKENNRGWTVRTYSLGSNYIDIFLSRGDYEKI